MKNLFSKKNLKNLDDLFKTMIKNPEKTLNECINDCENKFGNNDILDKMKNVSKNYGHGSDKNVGQMKVKNIVKQTERKY